MAIDKKTIFRNAAPALQSFAQTVNEWLMRATPSAGTANVESVHVAMGTSSGLVRHDNQDRAIVAKFRGTGSSDAFCLYAVADGLGGMVDGAPCASLALTSMLTHLVSTRLQKRLVTRLEQSVQFANTQTHAIYNESGGTTVSAVVATNRDIAATNVGDSRIYAHLSDGKFQQLSIDDTIAGRLANMQNRSQSSFDEQPYGGHLAQFVGQRSPVEPQAINVSRLWRKKRKSVTDDNYVGLLLCSDGIYKQEDTALLADVANAAPRPFDAVKRWLAIADWRGGADNSTALYISAYDESISYHERSVRNAIVELWDSFGELSISLLDVQRIVIPEARNVAGDRKKPKTPRKRRRKTAKKFSHRKTANENLSSDVDADNPEQKEMKIEITESEK